GRLGGGRGGCRTGSSAPAAASARPAAGCAEATRPAPSRHWRRALDRLRRGSADGERGAERRRAPAERPAGPALARSRGPPRAERDAPVAALERGVVAADPAARSEAARAPPGEPGLDPLRRPRATGSLSRSLVNRRIRLLLLVLVLALGGTFLRAAWLQGVRAASLARMADVQHRETVALPASRGTIYDRTGVQLALGEQATTVYADPRQIRNPRSAALLAGRTLGVDPSKLYARLADRTKGFVYVARKADPARAALLERRHVAGFGFYPEERRSYPEGSVAAQVLEIGRAAWRERASGRG